MAEEVKKEDVLVEDAAQEAAEAGQEAAGAAEAGDGQEAVQEAGAAAQEAAAESAAPVAEGQAEEKQPEAHAEGAADAASQDSAAGSAQDGAGEAIPSMDDFKEELEASLKKHGGPKRADMEKWEKLQDDFENKIPVEVEIRDVVKGGVTTTLEGIRAFIPASKLSLSYVDEKDLSNFVGKRLMVRVITADAEQNKLVLSAKDILREEEAKLREERAKQIKPGLVTEGKVETIKDYGAFVNIGDGVTGLLHVSQISNKRVKTPADVLKEGQTVTVKVTKVQDGRISLSMKELETERMEKEEQRERENFRENYKNEGAATTSFGDLLKKSGIKF